MVPDSPKQKPIARENAGSAAVKADVVGIVYQGRQVANLRVIAAAGKKSVLMFGIGCTSVALQCHPAHRHNNQCAANFGHGSQAEACLTTHCKPAFHAVAEQFEIGMDCWDLNTFTGITE